MHDLENEARLARNTYLKEWRAKHPEAVKAQRERYWLRRAEKMLREREEKKHAKE